jgi:5-methylcytosine-specific restriction endonuclease McrA
MPSKSNYSSKRSNAARKTVRANGSGPCIRCGRWVDVDLHKWEADHIISRAEAQAHGLSTAELDSAQNLGLAHASCNHKAGAALGNALRAKAKAEPRRVPQVKRPQLGASDV